ncbi:MAG: hybrid sensor histidine kinase/response regulator [Fimbriimonadaceae bacterium]|nr:hybrid sensor histidine kinase/response regulator [Fimbriimonadaceae bacterium]
MERARLLVVDDEPVCREECAEELRSSYELCLSADPHTAIELAAARHAAGQGFDLAVLDYTMGPPDGFETFRRLRAATPDLAGLLCSGHTSLVVAVQALNLGFSQVLAKPWERGELKRAVEAALVERQTRLENARLKALTRLWKSLGGLAELRTAEELWHASLDIAVAETAADRASLMLLDPSSAVLQVVAARGEGCETAVGEAKTVGEPVSGWVCRHGVALELGPSKPLPQAVRQALRHPELGAAMSLPVAAAGQVLGVLNLARLSGRTGFQPGDLELAATVAGALAMGLQRLDLLRQQAHRERIATVGRLTSTIIHDLRGPVTILGGAAELLLETNPTAGPQLQVITEEVGELERMCRQLLSFARDPADGEPEIWSPAEVLAALADDVPTLARRGIAVTVAADVPARLTGVPPQLRRALGDLLESAAEVATPLTTLAWDVRPSGHGVELVLRGDAAAARQWWQSLDQPSSVANAGGGLPLAILQYLAEQHGGSLQVETPVGGFAIRFRLPCGLVGESALASAGHLA